MFRYLPVSLAFLVGIFFIGSIFSPNQLISAGRQEPNILDGLGDVNDPNRVEPNDIQTTSPANKYHDMCGAVLKTYIKEDGLVDYSTLKRQRLELKKILNAYDELSLDEYSSWSEDDKKAFWLNAYNIQMLKIISENYPIQSTTWGRIIYGPYSIRNIEKIWMAYKFLVMDEEFTLNEVEQRFFRDQFKDPRLFISITYASASSPDIPRVPYTGEKLDKQIDDHIRKFFQRQDAFSIDHSKNIVHISALFQKSWHGDEFIDKYDTEKKFKDQSKDIRAVLNFLINYLPDEDVSYLELENYKVRFINYDWTINDTELRYQIRR